MAGHGRLSMHSVSSLPACCQHIWNSSRSLQLTVLSQIAYAWTSQPLKGDMNYHPGDEHILHEISGFQDGENPYGSMVGGLQCVVLVQCNTTSIHSSISWC